MKKPEPGTLQTYASLRFSGDRLEPQRLTAILNARPEIAYRKGDVFKVSRGHEVRGRTGVWVISSKGDLPSLDLNEHLDYLLGLLFPEGSEAKLNRLHELMRECNIEADAPCFWYGEHGAKPPVIREDIRDRLARIPAEIWADFDTD
jgi:uncharacterized protein DUF4279